MTDRDRYERLLSEEVFTLTPEDVAVIERRFGGYPAVARLITDRRELRRVLVCLRDFGQMLYPDEAPVTKRRGECPYKHDCARESCTWGRG